MHRILADTNILQYNTSKVHADMIVDLSEAIRRSAYTLVISDYTIFEVYRGLAPKRVGPMKTLVDSLSSIEVDAQTFKIAAALSTCYRNHEATRLYADRYSDGDLVLAATAFRHNMLLLTANGNDFPRPFFEEIHLPSLAKVTANSKLPIAVLKPEITKFNAIVGEYFKP